MPTWDNDSGSWDSGETWDAEVVNIAMGTSLFGFINVADLNPPFWAPTFFPGVGNWQPGAPLTNMQNRFLAYKARSVNCAKDSTTFVVDLGQPQAILAVVLPRHNLSLTATMRVTLYSDAALTMIVGASVLVNVAQKFAWGSLPFGSPYWFNGIITAETARFVPQPAMVIFSDTQIARYVKVELVDTDNADGYIELSRLFICPGYRPTQGIKIGAQSAINDPTIETKSLGGASLYDLRPKYRSFIGSIDYLDENEAFANVFIAQLRLGISGQFFFSMYPDNPNLFALTSFIATLEKIDPITASSVGLSGVPFSIKEVVA